MAIFSWNLLMVLVALSFADDPNNPQDQRVRSEQPFRTDGCSFAAPAYCGNVSAYNSITGVRRNAVIAGGNGQFGRRDFIWHGGGDLVLRYEKRNVLGFSMDFAEDFTKSNWGIEFTWIEGLPFTNHNSFDQHQPGGYLQPDPVGGPAHLHQLPQPEPDRLLQQPVVLPVRERLPVWLHHQRPLERAGDLHGHHRLLPGSAASGRHLRVRLRGRFREASCRR